MIPRSHPRCVHPRHGAVFTLDALLALLAAAILFTAILFFMSRVESAPFSRDVLATLAEDSLAVLEKDGSLLDAHVTGSNATLLRYLDALPLRFCGRLGISDAEGNLLVAAQRSGCETPEEQAVARRVFVGHRSDAALARMDAWYLNE